MIQRLIAAVLLLAVCSAQAAVVSDDIEVEGYFIKLNLHPGDGGMVEYLGLLAAPGNLAGPDGLLQEGFGVGSYYVPNRRVNEKMEVLEQFQDRPVFEYSYDCDGPNINGLHVVRRMEMDPNEASVRVTWTIENKGQERHWIAPWVRQDVAAGGAAESRDLVEMMSLSGKAVNPENGFHPASRNWIAVTDPLEEQTLYTVYDATKLHSILTLRGSEGKPVAYAAHFVPFELNPGQSWSTMYRLNAVRGLKHVDFATDELAIQLDYNGGKLTALMSAARPIDGLEIHARVMAKNGRVWDLPAKKFDISPKQLVRATYEWDAPANDTYEFLAQLRQGGKPFGVGQDTKSPHGGFDTQFAVGPQAQAPLEPWTDAPYALEQRPRTLRRTLAANGPVQVWRESTMEKVLRGDAPEPTGAPDPVVRMSLARRESESLQLALRSPGKAATGLGVQVSELRNAEGAVIGPENIRVYRVGYVDSRVPSHWEGPTGAWPDILEPNANVDLRPDSTQPVWITVYAPYGTAPGTYTGSITLAGPDLEPIKLTLLAEVYNFQLPVRPTLQTDFGLDLKRAAELHRAAGGKLSDDELAARFAATALSHRVTLDGLTALPAESPNYAAALKKFEAGFDARWDDNATSFNVPATLLEFPEQLKQANDFVAQHKLGDRAFVELFHEPREAAWTRVLETMQRWKDAAPAIPMRVSTIGLKPFIPDSLDQWMVHAQVLDTNNGVEVLKRVAAGKPVWWYVHHLPPRPYGNFFLDFAGIEHRILFWQSWALGMKGMHYWDVQYVEPGGDPRRSQLDITPVNGDGLLLYPGADGPLNSIRWEIIRDGIEDHDYLAEFMERRRALLQQGGHDALMKKASQVYNLDELVPTLVTFTRDPKVLEDKRHQIARMIEEMDAALR